MQLGHTKFTTSGAHDITAITSLQKHDFCTEELRDTDTAKTKLRSVYHLEKLDSVVSRERGLWS